jgi:hypothetical protein
MIINKLVDNSMNKAEAAKLREKYTRKLPGQKTVETDNRKKKK